MDINENELQRRLAEKAFPPHPGSTAAHAYEAAKAGSHFVLQKAGKLDEPGSDSSLRSFVIKLKDKRFHLHSYEEHREGSGRAQSWELMGDVLGEASFCDIDDARMHTRYLFAFIVPLNLALAKPKPKKAR